MVTGMDGIVFWGPLLIHTIMDGDSGSGDAFMPPSAMFALLLAKSWSYVGS